MFGYERVKDEKLENEGTLIEFIKDLEDVIIITD